MRISDWSSDVCSSDLSRPESAASLLAMPRRKRLLEHIWQRTSLSRKQFASLYRAPLERYAELVQLFPASESQDRTSGVEGKSVSVRVDFGGSRSIKKKKKKKN